MTWASHAHRAVKLRSNIDTKEVLVPVTTSINSNRARASLRQVFAHSGPEALEGVLNGIEGDLRADDDLAELAVELGMAKIDLDRGREQEAREVTNQVVENLVATAVNQLVRTETKVVGADGADIKGDWWTVATPERTWFECRAHDEPMEVETKAGVGGHNRVYHSDTPPMWENTPASIVKRAREEAVEVSRTPWLAKRGWDGSGRGRVTEHAYVEQVTYSDGRVTFACTLCDFTATGGRSVSVHVGKAHPDRERITHEAYKVTDYPEPEHHRTGHSPRLHADLLSALDSIEDWQLLSREELAHRIEEHIIENRPERAPTQPLTDAEILARIAALMDRGEFDHLRRQVDSLTDQVVSVIAERDEALTVQATAQEETERIAGELETLQSLVSSIQIRREVG